MTREQLLEAMIPLFADSSSVEGVVHYGALARQDADEYSDIDLLIVVPDEDSCFDEARQICERAVHQLVAPLAQSDHRWGHSWMLSAVYGPDSFPPIGTELDLIVLRLEHLPAQMPYATYRTIFDRRGQVAPLLEKLNGAAPRDQLAQQISGQIAVYPIFVFNALKAHHRGDSFRLQAMLDEMRKPIFDAAAARSGEQVFGAKRVGRFLNPDEQQALEGSYVNANDRTVATLADLYISTLDQLPQDLASAEQIRSLSTTVSILNRSS